MTKHNTHSDQCEMYLIVGLICICIIIIDAEYLFMCLLIVTYFKYGGSNIGYNGVSRHMR